MYKGIPLSPTIQLTRFNYLPLNISDPRLFSFMHILTCMLQLCRVLLVLVHPLQRSCDYTKFGQMDRWNFYNSPKFCLRGYNKKWSTEQTWNCGIGNKKVLHVGNLLLLDRTWGYVMYICSYFPWLIGGSKCLTTFVFYIWQYKSGGLHSVHILLRHFSLL